MNVTIHEINDTKIAEISSDAVLISSPEEGLQILVDVYYQDIDKIVLHKRNIISDFFDLKTGIAGEILQKFSNYKVRLAIVGDFSGLEGTSISAFMSESNSQKQVNFSKTVEEALRRLSN